MQPILSLRHYSHDYLAHSHAHPQLVIGLRGQLDFEMEGRGSRVLRHCLAVIPPATHHACSGSRGGSHCLVLDVPGEDWLRAQLGEHLDVGRRLLEKPHTGALAPAQQQLVDWLAASALENPLIARQGAALLLATLSSGSALSRPSGRLPLAALDAHIDRHAAHPLQVADLARLAGLSVARFHACFLAETGLTPMDYVRQRRLQLGMRLLRETALPVGEIACQVGYASQSAFTAALARHCGTTPRALRREARDKSR
ncbi:helix-turn-helix transcriptional regulator [Zestomonas thermotolerans]|uniref:helix-turn-helix transcriptional regulator n=1 Tax=Zestomonas thermotolerans TaxID=157784 RepID=UPI00037BEF32|nr:AraC family transcriptional regulator [Pseudomonas thermotolerans]MBO2511463.1 AraC family transcriptional regulator [Gammaproteobacteria bacterium]